LASRTGFSLVSTERSRLSSSRRRGGGGSEKIMNSLAHSFKGEGRNPRTRRSDSLTEKSSIVKDETSSTLFRVGRRKGFRRKKDLDWQKVRPRKEEVKADRRDRHVNDPSNDADPQVDGTTMSEHGSYGTSIIHLMKQRRESTCSIASSPDLRRAKSASQRAVGGAELPGKRKGKELRTARGNSQMLKKKKKNTTTINC